MLHDTDGSEKNEQTHTRQTQTKNITTRRCDEMGLPRLKRVLHMDAHRAPATKQNDVAYVDTNRCQRSHQGAAGRPAPSAVRYQGSYSYRPRWNVDDDVSDVNSSLSGGDTLLTKYLISARASRSKVETRCQLLHRIPEQLLSVGDIGSPVLGGEVVGVVSDEL
jgi:hypothetical protein